MMSHKMIVRKCQSPAETENDYEDALNDKKITFTPKRQNYTRRETV